MLCMSDKLVIIYLGNKIGTKSIFLFAQKLRFLVMNSYACIGVCIY